MPETVTPYNPLGENIEDIEREQCGGYWAILLITDDTEEDATA